MRLLRNLAFAKPCFRHEEAGFNFRMTGYQAAMGVAHFSSLGAEVEPVLVRDRAGADDARGSEGCGVVILKRLSDAQADGDPSSARS